MQELMGVMMSLGDNRPTTTFTAKAVPSSSSPRLQSAPCAKAQCQQSGLMLMAVVQTWLVGPMGLILTFFSGLKVPISSVPQNTTYSYLLSLTTKSMQFICPTISFRQEFFFWYRLITGLLMRMPPEGESVKLVHTILPSAVPSSMRPLALFMDDVVNLTSPWDSSKIIWYSLLKFTSPIFYTFITAILLSWLPIRKQGWLKEAVNVLVGSLYSETWKLFWFWGLRVNTLIRQSQPNVTTTSYFSTQTTLQMGAAWEPRSSTLLTFFMSTSPIWPVARPTMTSRSAVRSMVVMGWWKQQCHFFSSFLLRLVPSISQARTQPSHPQVRNVRQVRSDRSHIICCTVSRGWSNYLSTRMREYDMLCFFACQFEFGLVFIIEGTHSAPLLIYYTMR